uniref:Uncharacterized protein n=1 Tax=Anguilla anguilla TaxID=7936 RepID=A0A0E9WPI4_ANGAN
MCCSHFILNSKTLSTSKPWQRARSLTHCLYHSQVRATQKHLPSTEVGPSAPAFSTLTQLAQLCVPSPPATHRAYTVHVCYFAVLKTRLQS